MKPRPELQDGMVVYVGNDPRDNTTISYVYSSDRVRDPERRVLCFQDSLETFTKLGLVTGPHWLDHCVEQGYCGVAGVTINRGPNRKEPILDPVVVRLLEGKVENKSFAFLLSKEV